MYYKCHKIIFKHGGSYIDSTDLLIKKKKVTINPKNMDENFFSICSNRCVKLWRIQKKVSYIKLFINKHNWQIDDCKTFHNNNPAIVLNILNIKIKIYVQVISQKLIWIVKNKYFS